MQFVSMREFTSSPKKTQERLSASKQLIVTNNGTPSMLVIDIVDQDFLKIIDYIRRYEALEILHKVQLNAAETEASSMSMEEIDAEIAAYRKENHR